MANLGATENLNRIGGADTYIHMSIDVCMYTTIDMDTSVHIYIYTYVELY